MEVYDVLYMLDRLELEAQYTEYTVIYNYV